MKMKEHLMRCKKRASQIKSDYPALSHIKRLDEAAKEQKFPHYTSMNNLHKQLGADKAPSRVNILLAGSDPKLSPYQAVSNTVSMPY